LEAYVKRLGDIERLAAEAPGVEKAFAVQAGKELRIFVRPDEVDDLQAIKMSHEIARQIEKQLQYSGKIKVEVIRERRQESFAG
jgi:ribonucrease Y